MNEVIRKKISETKKGMTFTDEHKLALKNNSAKYWLGKKRPGYKTNNGRKLSEEWKRKISISHLGKKNPMWKDGKSVHINKLILERDKYTCQICGLKDPEIVEVDHIVPRFIAPNLSVEPSNLMTLCPNCHRRKTKRDRKDIAQFKKQLK